MIRIGIIGEIGSGKTYVAKSFGYPVFNADAEVNKIYSNNRKCFEKLNRKFPKYVKKFPIKKNQIKQILNKKNIKIISKIVHPYVRLSLKKFLRKNKNNKYVVLDIPLLLENQLDKKKDILVCIKTHKKKIFKRLKKRGGYEKKIIEILKSQQLNINKKFKVCDFIIENNSYRNNIFRQIKIIKKKLND